ncbi:hypothetical protein K458DRAFT_409549 [Lentithecium fluviatile CBS 122367]|uniref:Lytic polysaccharide monooxygenase n=1 Tax=Lentithecium fluviatile CBS 122367 TaxID=1168545 RepID=A0A6G1IH38_9PLEO|nr:hypothetical protein K458DRAFT_409549 [Lentithecium fluviatile CBS 122367]
MKSTLSLFFFLLATRTLDDHLTFPYIAQGSAGALTDEWADFHARAMDVQSGITTYSVGCATTLCHGWEAAVDGYAFTIAIAENTYDLKYENSRALYVYFLNSYLGWSTHSACTFTGTPATTASCEMTFEGTIETSTYGEEHHFTTPLMASGTESDVRELFLDGTVGETLTTKGSGRASETGSRSPSASGSEMGPTPVPTPTSTGPEGGQVASSQSAGIAAKTGTPRLAVEVGIGVPALGMWRMGGIWAG